MARSSPPARRPARRPPRRSARRRRARSRLLRCRPRAAARARRRRRRRTTCASGRRGDAASRSRRPRTDPRRTARRRLRRRRGPAGRWPRAASGSAASSPCSVVPVAGPTACGRRPRHRPDGGDRGPGWRCRPATRRRRRLRSERSARAAATAVDSQGPGCNAAPSSSATTPASTMLIPAPPCSSGTSTPVAPSAASPCHTSAVVPAGSSSSGRTWVGDACPLEPGSAAPCPAAPAARRSVPGSSPSALRKRSTPGSPNTRIAVIRLVDLRGAAGDGQRSRGQSLVDSIVRRPARRRARRRRTSAMAWPDLGPDALWPGWPTRTHRRRAAPPRSTACRAAPGSRPAPRVHRAGAALRCPRARAARRPGESARSATRSLNCNCKRRVKARRTGPFVTQRGGGDMPAAVQRTQQGVDREPARR